jgi:tetratricopeptide (TPR) repeat protein
MSSRRFWPKCVRAIVGLLLAGCAAVGSPPRPERLALVALLKDGQFTALETTLDGYQQQFEADPQIQWPAIEAFKAFHNSDPAIEPRLNEWVAKMPDSYAAALARGVFYDHVGTLCRDASYGATVDDHAFDAMDRDLAQARLDLQRALALNPHLVYAYEMLADMATADDNRLETERILKAGLAEAPDAIALYIDVLSNVAPSAVHDYLAILGQRHPKVAAHPWFRGYEDYQDGYRFLAQERYADALAAFDRAVAIGPRVPGFHMGRAEALFGLGRYDEAIAAQERVVEIWPDAPGHHADLAKFLMLRGGPDARSNMEKALASMNKAIALDQLSPCYLNERAIILDTLGRYREAAADLDAAMTYGAYNPKIQLERAYVLMRFGDRFEDAAASARRATELQRSSSLAWLRYAEALFLKQDCKAQEALRVFHQLCRSDGRCEAEKTDSSASGIIQYMQCPKI